jgi:uncharacterized membrane protein
MDMKRKIIGVVLVVIGIILIVLWSLVKSNFTAQGVFLCDVVSSNPNVEMAQCPTHTSSTPTLVSIGLVFSVLVFLCGFFLMFITKTVINEENGPPDLNELSDIEGSIYRLLTENGGSMYQSDLVKRTNLTKVKITRVLDHLEYNLKLIERKRRGMTNIVVLR